MATSSAFSRDTAEKAKNTSSVLEDSFEQAEKKVTDTVEKGRETVSKVIGAVQPTLVHGYEEAEKAVQSAVKSTGKLIKQYPIQSLLIGFGVGALLGVGARSWFSSKA